jgi:hypothetical protein
LKSRIRNGRDFVRKRQKLISGPDPDASSTRPHSDFADAFRREIS